MNRILSVLFLAGAIGTPVLAQGLTVWTTFGPPTIRTLEEEVSAFSSTFGVDVEVVEIDLYELEQRMLRSAEEGGAGDVLVGIPHDQIGAMAVAGVLADLSAAATPDYLADLSAQARLAFEDDGRLLGLPLFVEGPALVYNRRLVPELPASYGELVTLAQDLTEGDTFGFLHDISNFYFSYAWLSTFGGYVFAREDGGWNPRDVGLANEGAAAGAEALRTLRFEAGLIPSGTTYDVASRLFIDGALAMTYDGPWLVPTAREAGVDVGVAPMPPLSDGTPWTGFMVTEGVLVNRFSEDRTAAFNLAKWLTRADAQVRYATLEGRIPASTGALAQIAPDSIVAGFGRALLDAEPIPTVPEMGEVWGPMGRALASLTEEASAEAPVVLREAVERILGD